MGNIQLFILIIYLCFIIIMKFIFFFIYKNHKLKFIGFNPSTISKTYIQVIASFSNFYNLDINVINSKKNKLIFHNYNAKKNTFYYNDSTFNNWTTLELDYLLGRLWLVVLFQKNKITFKKIKFYCFILPLMSFIALIIFLILNLLFNIVTSNTMINNQFIEFIIKFNIFFIFTTFLLSLYLLSLLISYYFKQNLENLYEKSINNYLVENFSSLIYNFSVIRKIHKNIPITMMPIWCFHILNNNNTNLGPFSSVF